MTDSVSDLDLQRLLWGDRISAAIAHLRQLTQISIQSSWHCCLADLPISEATQADTWQRWAVASLNDRGHVDWAEGRQVLWLGQQLIIPEALQGYPVRGLALRLALTWWAEEAQIFVDGVWVQAGDLFDCATRILLSDAAQPGEAIAIAIRLVSPGHDPGALVRSVCFYEATTQAVQPYPEPGFVADELEVLQTYLAAFQPETLEDLAAAIAQIPWEMIEQRSAFDQALSSLRQQLLPFGDWIKQRRIQLLGHAHLDLAWLWTVSETWEAAERTFKSVLQLQQDFSELIFCHSTPALYAWIEENRPDLFATIQAQIAAERWEVVAGLWVEPELNLISGESIARQVLYGQQYVRQRFGKVSAIAWLPDTFGFCWQLPQILKQGGIEYFVTQKLRWNDTSQFPYDAFWWQSPDGTQIFCLNSAPIGESLDPLKMIRYACTWETKTGCQTALWLPGVGDHGGGPSRDMLETARRWQHSPFFPRLEFSTALNFLDRLKHQKLEVRSQRKTAQSKIQNSEFSNSESSGMAVQGDLSKLSEPFPIWNSELYLEFHRGCYTTHADQKQQNRRCETLLYEAELFAALATLTAGAAYPKQAIETAWKQVLFNQFHDILPGSSIPAVYTEANQAWQAAEAISKQILDAALETIASQIILPPPPHPEAKAVVVFNSLNWQRSQNVTVVAEETQSSQQTSPAAWQMCDLAGKAVQFQRCVANDMAIAPGRKRCSITFLAENIPAIGYRCFWLCPDDSNLASSQSPIPDSASSQEFILENERLRVTVDQNTGDLSSVFDKIHQREILSGPGNQLQAFRDQGQYWDAWNIDPDYAQHPLPPAELVSIQYSQSWSQIWGRLKIGIEVIRKISQSIFSQTYVLQPGSAVLQIQTKVRCLEHHILVKAAFPFNLAADYATYEVPYGAIQRPTCPQTDSEKAQWEVPALRWADLSDRTYGVSLLSDCKHGFDSQPNQLRLTLLRSSKWPDPNADRGDRQFTYALYPHSGNWQAAQTVQRGYELSQPLWMWIVEPLPDGALMNERRSLPSTAQLIDLQANNLILSAFKQAEDDPNQWILRCYECCGEAATLNWQDSLGLILSQYLEVETLQRTNLLEEPDEERPDEQLDEQLDEQSKLANNLGRAIVAPWQIATFAFRSSSRSSSRIDSRSG